MVKAVGCVVADRFGAARAHRAVTIARDAAARKCEHLPDALVGHRAVADQVAGTEIAVDFLRREERERGIEGVRVAVDVGDDAVTHQTLTLNLRSMVVR